MTLSIQGVAPLIQVFDMPTSLQFYRDQLGFEVTQTSPQLSENPDDVNWAMLQMADVTIMLNTAYEPEHRPEKLEPGRFSGHGDTCLYFGCPDVDAAYKFLREQGLAVEPPKVAQYGMKQLYVKDPDGYMLCFQWTAKSA